MYAFLKYLKSLQIKHAVKFFFLQNLSFLMCAVWSFKETGFTSLPGAVCGHWCRNWGGSGPLPIFCRSVNPIPTKGDRLVLDPVKPQKVTYLLSVVIGFQLQDEWPLHMYSITNYVCTFGEQSFISTYLYIWRLTICGLFVNLPTLKNRLLTKE